MLNRNMYFYLQEQLKLKAKTKSKVKGSNKRNSTNLSLDIIRKRHAGVLGLCAFINSHPYDVPDYLPDIFKQLGPHLNDPQPMPVQNKLYLVLFLQFILLCIFFRLQLGKL